MTRLLIVSNMSHYLADGQLVGWGPTVEEISHIAQLFDEVVHIGCLHQGPAPASSLPYTCDNLRFVSVPPAGGRTLKHKLDILKRSPGYVRAIVRELPHADAVHVRAPANISLLAMVLLAFARRPKRRWIKYAGNWRPEGSEPFSYRFQRWWLRRNFARAKVTVNGRWPGQPVYVVSFPNPCFSLAEWRRATSEARQKRLSAPLRLIFVGALTPNKGPRRVLETLAVLRDRSVEAGLALAGEGAERVVLEDAVRAMGLESQVEFLGFVPRPALGKHYHRAHFVLLPSLSEGWPKVLSEGMAHGAVPIASAVSSIPQVLAEAGCGCAVPTFRPEDYAQAILNYLNEPERWRREVEAGCIYAERFTYEAHVRRVREVLDLDEKP